jgi:hypothetical protein
MGVFVFVMDFGIEDAKTSSAVATGNQVNQVVII